jgi:hypothetical protein
VACGTEEALRNELRAEHSSAVEDSLSYYVRFRVYDYFFYFYCRYLPFLFFLEPLLTLPNCLGCLLDLKSGSNLIKGVYLTFSFELVRRFRPFFRF